MNHVFEMIPQYINALEKAKKQVERAEMPFSDATLVIMSTKAMLETKRYHNVDDVWEDLYKTQREW